MASRLEYKVYHADLEIDFEGHVLHGKIYGIGDLVTFESETVDGVIKEFHSAVDDYLDFCAEVGKAPDTPNDILKVVEYA